jgi:alpha-N-acetylglucosamine transferase
MRFNGNQMNSNPSQNNAHQCSNVPTPMMYANNNVYTHNNSYLNNNMSRGTPYNSVIFSNQTQANINQNQPISNSMIYQNGSNANI